METSLDLSAILELDQLDSDAYQALKELAFAGKESLNRFIELLSGVEREAEAGRGDVAKAALKLGMCYSLLGNTEKAVAWLEKAGDSAEKHFRLGLAYREQKRHRDSITCFEEAARGSWDRLECDCQRAESLVLLGELDEADRLLRESAAAGTSSAQWHYVKGRLLHEQGELEAAIASLEAAREIDEQHAHATFHLAYLLHLHGSDQRAKELYEAAAQLPYVHIHTLLNLAVIYEDECDYDRAAECLRRILVVDPNHSRAHLYLRDVLATGEMFIDEQEMLSTEQRNAVLDIPVSDFELSVRSRNCLKKMNIHTLGDLLRATEMELLSYKNFGETSLKEIKVMLAQKGLALGQLADEGRQQETGEKATAAQPETPGVSADVLNMSVSNLIGLSVRSRKCLQLLGIGTVRELMNQTEAALMQSPNFGETSLEEIKRALASLGLSLAESKPAAPDSAGPTLNT
ncbi:MAG: DNA-directed RNA polymerase subunit alpha C-terminal domain-containing protein [Phycisphaerae bacterium]